MFLLSVKACLLLLLAIMALMHYVFVNGSRLYPTPLSLFLLYQGLGFAGTVIHADLAGYSTDRTRTVTMAVGLFLAVAGGIAANVAFRFRPRAELGRFREVKVRDDARGARAMLVLAPIALVSLAVGVLYVRAMGYNLPLELLRAYQAAGDASGSAMIYGQLRTSVWRDPSRYIAPGYAAQFIKILLPAVLFILYFRARITRLLRDGLLAVAVALPTVYFLAATGIRSYVILFGAMFVTLASRRFGPFGDDSRMRTKLVYPVAGGAAALFGLLTFLGGRSSRGESLLENVGGIVWGLVERIVFIPSDAQFAALRVLGDGGRGWGRGWLQGLTILLPGSQSTQSTELFALVYGGVGNAPADLWTSLWFEFGWIGIIIGPLILSFVLQAIHIRFIRGPKLLTRTILFTMMSFTLILVSEPIAVFNYGFVTLLIMHGLILTASAFDARRMRSSRPLPGRPAPVRSVAAGHGREEHYVRSGP